MKSRKWTTAENHFLMENAHKIPWSEIAHVLGRTELACKNHFEKIRKLRIKMGTWKGI